MTLKIISAEKIIFTGSVTSVTLPGAIGEFMVLKNHASLISALVAGTVRYVDETGKESSLSVEGGIADVDNNVISVCIY